MQINQRVLSRAVSWLLQQQGPQGEFREVGRVIHTEMQGGLDGGSAALTAYVLMALLEDESYVVSQGGNQNQNSAQRAQRVRLSSLSCSERILQTNQCLHIDLFCSHKPVAMVSR